MTKRLLFLLAIALPSLAQAQWRVGATIGADRNHYSIDTHYQFDVQYQDRWSMTAGIVGQYDFLEWLGVRAELNWIQKNYGRKRDLISSQDYRVINNYLQLPIMASFSFGNKKVRGFCNLGFYGGYWLNAFQKGSDFNSISSKTFSFNKSYDFDSDRDCRWEFGYVGGAGVEYRFTHKWAAQMELRYYYGVTSNYKSGKVNDPRYHSTLALQAAVFYSF